MTMTPAHPQPAALREHRAQVLDMIAARAPARDIFVKVAESVESLHPGAIAGVTILDGERKVFEDAIFPSLEPAFAAAIPGLGTAPPHVGTCAQAAYQGVSVRSINISHEPRFDAAWRALCLAHGIKSIESTPAKAPDGRTLGTFVIGFREAAAVAYVADELIAFGADLNGLVLDYRMSA